MKKCGSHKKYSLDKANYYVTWTDNHSGGQKTNIGQVDTDRAAINNHLRSNINYLRDRIKLNKKCIELDKKHITILLKRIIK